MIVFNFCTVHGAKVLLYLLFLHEQHKNVFQNIKLHHKTKEYLFFTTILAWILGSGR